MAINSGRTVERFDEVWIDNSAGTLTKLVGISQVPEIGLGVDTTDLTALADAARGGLPGIPDFQVTYTGVWNSTDHTTLTGITNGYTPLSFDNRIGIRHAWESGEPQFGITSSATDGVLVRNYKTNYVTYSFEVYMYPGSAAPAHGTAAET